MGKVIIKKEFHDKNNYSKIYKVGEIHEFTSERISYLESLGLVALKEETIATNPKKSKKEK